MGKVKAYELKDVDASFVSFVEQGANGQKQFDIFKSIDAPKTEVKKDGIQVTDENLGFLKKVYNILKGLNKKNSINKENYQMDEQIEKKLIKDVGDLTDSIGAMVKGISVITKEVAGLKKTAADNVPEEKSELQKTVDALQAEISGLKKDAEDDGTDDDKDKGEVEKSAEVKKIEDLKKQIAELEKGAGEENKENADDPNTDLKKDIDDLKKGIEDLKKARGLSNSQTSEITKNADDDEEGVFSGLL